MELLRRTVARLLVAIYTLLMLGALTAFSALADGWDWPRFPSDSVAHVGAPFQLRSFTYCASGDGGINDFVVNGGPILRTGALPPGLYFEEDWLRYEFKHQPPSSPPSFSDSDKYAPVPGLHFDFGHDASIVGVPQRAGDWYFSVQFGTATCGGDTHFADLPEIGHGRTIREGPPPIQTVHIKTIGSAVPKSLP
jgi:hypothetical protein